MPDLIQEFENKGTFFAVYEYDPLSETCLQDAMSRMNWNRQEAINYANYMLNLLRSMPNRIMPVPTGLLILRREGDPDAHQVAAHWNKTAKVRQKREEN